MFFQTKPTLVVYLQRDRLTLVKPKSQAVLALPPALVMNLEVVDAKQLHDQVHAFLGANKISSGRIILALAESLVFRRTLTLAKVADPAAATKDFESKLPFAPEDRQILSITHKDQIDLFGVGRAFYETVATALREDGCKLLAVVPAIEYGASETKKLSAETLARLLDDEPNRSANFLAKA